MRERRFSVSNSLRALARALTKPSVAVMSPSMSMVAEPSLTTTKCGTSMDSPNLGSI